LKTDYLFLSRKGPVAGRLDRSWNTAIDDRWIVNPSTLVDFRAGFARQGQFRNPDSPGVNLTGLGFSRLWANSVPLDALLTLNPQGFPATFRTTFV
jgi:hypothetical protein